MLNFRAFSQCDRIPNIDAQVPNGALELVSVGFSGVGLVTSRCDRVVRDRPKGAPDYS